MGELKSFWPIIGYGVDISNFVDLEKVRELLTEYGINLEENPREVLYQFAHVLVVEIAPRMSSIGNYLAYASKEERGEEVYIYLPALLPWEAEDGYAGLSRRQIEDVIADLLEPYLFGTRREELIDAVGFIFEVGGGEGFGAPCYRCSDLYLGRV